MEAARSDNVKAIGAGSLRRGWLRSFTPLAAISCAGALYVLFAGNPLESQEQRLRDLLLRWRSNAGLAPAVDPHVVHLDLTAADLGVAADLTAEYQDAADIIDEASELRATAIVFDVVFGRGAEKTARPILDAIERAKARNCAVVLSEFLRDDAERARSFPFRERMQPAGLINVKSDADGVFRRYALLQRTPEGLEPSLALAAYLAWRGMDWAKDVTAAGSDAVSWQELSADAAALEKRVAGVAPVLLNLRVPWEMRGPAACRHYNRAQLRSLHSENQDAAKEVPPRPNASPLANRVMLVSYADPGIGDAATTPLGLNQPRALLHATALEDLIQQRALRRLPRWGEAAALACLLVFGCAASLCRRPIWALALWLAVAAGVIGSSFLMLLEANTVFGGVSVIVVWTAMIAVELIQRSRAAIRIRDLPGSFPQPPQPGPAVSPQAKRVFISARSVDYRYAREVHEFLGSRGVPSFFSEETLLERGSADYREEIDNALDEADHMVVVASSAANVKSKWVNAEWGFFLNEIRTGRKRGNLVIVAVGSLVSGDLPPGLRYFEKISLDKEGMEKLLKYTGKTSGDAEGDCAPPS
jgi:CHASE2 domain-containing sensor protein